MIDANNPAELSAAARSPLRRFIQWFLGSDVSESTQATEQAAAKISVLHVRRARLALELGDRALDYFEPLQNGPGQAVAISMLRESVYWALTARCPDGPSKSLRAAFDTADRDLLTNAAGNDSLVDAIRAALVERTFVETAELPAKVQAHEARLARDFAGALIASLEEPPAAVRKIVARRRARLALVATAIVALLLLVVQQASKKRDLAAGKSWRTSSPSGCDVTFGYCGGKFVELLFHTTEEDSPWAELDLGRAREFTSIEVRNREDCCKERAVPLVVKASSDGESWKELGRETNPFDVWNLTFPSESARYLRFVVERRTMFHLKSVSVR